MKKSLFFITVIMLIGNIIFAQEKDLQSTQKKAPPVLKGCYSSDNPNNFDWNQIEEYSNNYSKWVGVRGYNRALRQLTVSSSLYNYLIEKDKYSIIEFIPILWKDSITIAIARYKNADDANPNYKTLSCFYNDNPSSRVVPPPGFCPPPAGCHVPFNFNKKTNMGGKPKPAVKH